MVRDHVLGALDDPDLVVYVVWERILRTDDARAAKKATTLLADPRARHYWVETDGLGERFQAAIGLTTEPAWDVYLLYAPGVAWGDPDPPAPASFMHRLRGRLPPERLLDGPRLAGEVRALLDR